MKNTYKRAHSSVWKGLIAGAVAGLGASWVMNQFQAAVSKIERTDQPAPLDENANTKAAEAVAHRVLHRDLTQQEKQPAGSAAHYAFGTAMGALYGAAAELAPLATTGAGTAFGAALWLVADEIVVPVLDLSKSPGEYSASVHASALAAHLVYGVTTDAIRRGVRRVI